MGARGGGGVRGGGGGASSRSAAAPQAAPKAPNAIDAFLSKSEHNTADVFSHRPEVKMQDKLHDSMYSGGTKEVNSGVSMDIGSLIPTQNKVWSTHVSRYTKPSKWDDQPIVATYKGKNYVIDGHHRIVGAKLQGNKTIKVKQYVLK